MALDIDVSEHRHWLETCASPSVKAAILCDVCKEKSQEPVYKSCKEMHESSMKDRADAVNFDCSICLDVCQDPVVTMCGHLFCWSCLHCWLSLRSISKECPVCKADVEDKIIPLYGCGKVGYSDSMPQKFFYIHTSSCRSSDSRRIPQITQEIASYDGAPSNGIRYSEMHAIHARQTTHWALLSFFASLLASVGLACLALGNVGEAGAGYLCRRARTNVASLLARHRRRLISEKEFVFHWVFICVASIAIVYFLAY